MGNQQLGEKIALLGFVVLAVGFTTIYLEEVKKKE